MTVIKSAGEHFCSGAYLTPFKEPTNMGKIVLGGKKKLIPVLHIA
ncbi:hypothetical protein [Colwellia sp. KU-HH00111]